MNWKEVKPVVEKYLGEIPDLEVFVYLPKDKELQEDTSKNEEGPHGHLEEDHLAADSISN